MLWKDGFAENCIRITKTQEEDELFTLVVECSGLRCAGQTCMEYLGYVATQAALADFAASLKSYPFENKHAHLSLGRENTFDMKVGLLSPAGLSYVQYKMVEGRESLDIQISCSPNSLNIFGQKLWGFLIGDVLSVEHIFSDL